MGSVDSSDWLSNSSALSRSYLDPSSPSSPSSSPPDPSSNTSTHSVPFEASSTLVTALVSLVVFLVGLVGNTLAIYVLLRYAKMKTVTNTYILNLAVADELYILGLPFLTTQNVLSYWPFGSFLCRVVMTADSMNQFTSIFCLTVMSIDRYLAVVHPIRSTRWRRPRVAKAVSAAVWGLSLVVVLPVVVFSDVQETFHSCNMIWPEPKDAWSTAFILYTATLGFFGPLMVICLCYLLIVVKVKSSGARAGFTKRRRSERKVTRMVVVIVVVFVLCWLPFFIINMVNLVVIIPESSVTAGIYFFSVILSYANSCANPLLYGFLSDNFKQSFRKVLCLRKTNGVEDGDPSATPGRATEKTTTHDSSFLTPRGRRAGAGAQGGAEGGGGGGGGEGGCNGHIPLSCQVSPHLLAAPTSHGSTPHPSPSLFPAAAVSVTAPLVMETSTLTTPPSSASAAHREL